MFFLLYRYFCCSSPATSFCCVELCKLNRERNSGCLHHEYFIFNVHGCIAIIYHFGAAIKSDLRAVWEIFPFSRYCNTRKFPLLFHISQSLFSGIFLRVVEWCWAEHGENLVANLVRFSISIFFFLRDRTEIKHNEYWLVYGRSWMRKDILMM